MPGEDGVPWRSRWKRPPSSCSAGGSGSPRDAFWPYPTPSRTAAGGGSKTMTWSKQWREWARSRRRPSTPGRGSGSVRVARSAELGQLPRQEIERVLDGLEALGDRAQAPGETVDVVSCRQIQIADRAGPRLRRALPSLESEVQRLVHPRVLDQDLGEVTQRSLASRGDAIAYAFAAAFVHIVHARYRDPSG